MDHTVFLLFWLMFCFGVITPLLFYFLRPFTSNYIRPTDKKKTKTTNNKKVKRKEVYFYD
jgi:hypothetical protein